MDGSPAPGRAPSARECEPSAQLLNGPRQVRGQDDERVESIRRHRPGRRVRRRRGSHAGASHVSTRDLRGRLDIATHHRADHDCSSPRPGNGIQPIARGQIRTEIADSDSGPPCGRRKSDSAQVVLCAGRQPDQNDRRLTRDTGCHKGHVETPPDRAPRCMLSRHVDSPSRPALAQCNESRHHEFRPTCSKEPRANIWSSICSKPPSLRAAAEVTKELVSACAAPS